MIHQRYLDLHKSLVPLPAINNEIHTACSNNEIRTETISGRAQEIRGRYEELRIRADCLSGRDMEEVNKPHLRHNVWRRSQPTDTIVPRCTNMWSPTNNCDSHPGKTTTISIRKSTETESVKQLRSNIGKQRRPSAEGSHLPEPAQKRETEIAV